MVAVLDELTAELADPIGPARGIATLFGHTITAASAPNAAAGAALSGPSPLSK